MIEDKRERKSNVSVVEFNQCCGRCGRGLRNELRREGRIPITKPGIHIYYGIVPHSHIKPHATPRARFDFAAINFLSNSKGAWGGVVGSTKSRNTGEININIKNR